MAGDVIGSRLAGTLLDHFHVDTSQWKNVSGVFQARNNDDSGFVVVTVAQIGVQSTGVGELRLVSTEALTANRDLTVKTNDANRTIDLGGNLTISGGNVTINGPFSGPNLGTATLDFGSTPGTNIVETAVIGQAAILSTSQIQVWMQEDSTATHNAYEHTIVPLKLTGVTIVPGVGFTIRAVTDWRLDGTFKCRWSWQ